MGIEKNKLDLEALIRLAGQTEPIRRQVGARFALNGQGEPELEVPQADFIGLSPDGSTDQFSVQSEVYFYACGHGKNDALGGLCGEPDCYSTECGACFGTCDSCRKPICQQHSHYFSSSEKKEQRLCRSCKDEARSRIFRRNLTCILTRPFHKKES